MTSDYSQMDFDGLVVESPRGDRLLALPIAVLEVLRYASVIQYRRGGRVYRMRIDSFLDNRDGGQAVTVVRDEMQPDANPSPTPPPAPEEAREGEDPANIPLYVKRAGAWTVTHVTRADYERYHAEGRISQESPGLIEEDTTDDDQH
jgi:hypothetical protein